MTTKPLRIPYMPMAQQNAHSDVVDVAATRVTGQGGPLPPNATFARWRVTTGLPQSALRLRDVDGFDFRPAPDSPLVGAGLGGRDVGAYQSDDPAPWRPGCTFTARCAIIN